LDFYGISRLPDFPELSGFPWNVRGWRNSTSEKFEATKFVTGSSGEKLQVKGKISVGEIRTLKKFEVAESPGEKTPSQKKTQCWRNLTL